LEFFNYIILPVAL